MEVLKNVETKILSEQFKKVFDIQQIKNNR